jgi:putative IMPACT (imprinted ancient) family translation regulator
VLRRYALDFDAEYRDAVEFRARIRNDSMEEFARMIAEVSRGRAGFVVEQS